MAEDKSRQPPRKPKHADDAANHHPKGTPTEERRDTEVAGGQIGHEQPLTTKNPAAGEHGGG